MSFELTIVELLLIVSVVAVLARRIRVPYTVVLVLVGLLLSFQDALHFELTPEIILLIILPPLVFEAALHIEVKILRQVLGPVLLLAIPGVLIVTFLVGGTLDILSPQIGWQTALVFGALIAATDPVAVVSLFKTLGAPRRLATLVESESIFNDGTTIVIFHIIVSVLFVADVTAHGGGAIDANVVDFIGKSVFEFIRVALGGVAIGVVFGIVGDRVFSLIDDHLIEVTVSTVIAYGSYVLAESFHLSGVLAVVMAGIIVGMRSSGTMSPTTRMVLINFWEYVAFLANSIIFILIGMEVQFSSLVSGFFLIIAAVGAVLLARGVSVYGLSLINNLFSHEKVSFKYQHVLFWGGLRGAVSLALVLSLSRDIPNRDILINMTFGVVLFTLLVQATTIGGLLNRLGLVGRPQAELDYEQIQGRLLAARAARQRLSELHNAGVVDPHAWEVVSAQLTQRIDRLQTKLTEFATANPQVVEKIIHSTQREVLRTQRAAILDLQREGVISEAVAHELYEEIDVAMDETLCLDPNPASSRADATGSG
ncbi:MAG TPA: Na+/H+ antiporter [Caldilineae bacterium]|nr:Na+/H+ antiporter [Caldilineae bacterium]